METLGERLRVVRRGLGLSLRRTATLLEDAGYPVSHDAVHKYERGRTVPALYVAAFCRAFGYRPRWILSGEGPPLDPSWRPTAGDASREIADHAWTSENPDLLATTLERWADGAMETWTRPRKTNETGGLADARLRPGIRRSWERSRAVGVDPTDAAPPPRLPPEELEARRERYAFVVDAGTPHLDWLASLHRDLEHVVYLTCPEGVILDSRSNPPELAEKWFLRPGYRWSEEVAGTNGAGTALETGEPTAVIGPEHYVEAYRGCTCMAAPLVGPDSSVVGAIDLSTTLECGDPRRLAVVAYAADNIGRRLRDGRAPGGPGSGR